MPKIITSAAAVAAVLIAAGAARADTFDARQPASIAEALKDAGATNIEVKKEEESEYILADKGELKFSVDFYTCGNRRQCREVVLIANWDTDTVSLYQINAWNQWTYECPAFLNDKKEPYVWLTLTMYGDERRTRIAQYAKNYFTCLDTFHDFVGDPEEFLTANVKGYQPEKPEPAAAKPPPAKP